MAFLDGYVGEDNPGNWYTIGRDSEKDLPVKFRIRPETRELREELDKKFARPEKMRGGLKIERIPRKLSEKADVHQAARCWTDSQNLWVRLRTKEAVQFYYDELKLNGQTVLTVGDEVCIDGKLSTKVKEEILNGNMPLVLTILGKARLLEEQAVDDEEEVTKNS